VRLGYRHGEGALLWGSVSRAVRAPSRVDRELFSPTQPPFMLAGGPDFRSEVANVFELGWRAQPTPGLSASVTLFDSEHERLRSLEATPAGLQFRNGITGRTYGAEGWVQWRATERWRLVAGGTALRQELRPEDGVVAVGGTTQLGNDPRILWSLRSELDFDPRLSWHLDVRHVGALPDPAVPSYTAVDTRLAWRLPNDVELAVVGRNLFDPRHAEWGPASNRVEFQRALWFQLRWRL
jgi:iron complex outermembrane receptor protein